MSTYMQIFFSKRALLNYMKCSELHEKISQDGMARLSTHSLSVLPHDYVTAEITYNTSRVLHHVLAWLWATLCHTPV